MPGGYPYRILFVNTISPEFLTDLLDTKLVQIERIVFLDFQLPDFRLIPEEFEDFVFNSTSLPVLQMLRPLSLPDSTILILGEV